MVAARCHNTEKQCFKLIVLFFGLHSMDPDEFLTEAPLLFLSYLSAKILAPNVTAITPRNSAYPPAETAT